MEQRKAKCVLEALNPFLTESVDSVSLHYNGKPIWSLRNTKLIQERRVEINTTLPVLLHEWVRIDLFVTKWFWMKSKVGEFLFYADGEGRTFSTDISNSKLRSYNLEWKLL